MYCGHQTLNDTKLIIDDLPKFTQDKLQLHGLAINELGKVNQTLARGARQLVVQLALETIDVRLVLMLVYAHYKHRSILARSRDNDLLGTTL